MKQTKTFTLASDCLTMYDRNGTALTASAGNATVGRYGDTVHRLYLRISRPDGLPEGAVITEATLTLPQTANGEESDIPMPLLGLYRTEMAGGSPVLTYDSTLLDYAPMSMTAEAYTLTVTREASSTPWMGPAKAGCGRSGCSGPKETAFGKSRA